MRRAILQKKCDVGLVQMIARGKDREKFLDVVRILCVEERVPSTLRPHKLHGEYEGLWECHIESDWLLIYKVTPSELLLARTGTHADLFE